MSVENPTKIDPGPIYGEMWEAELDEGENLTNTYSGRAMFGDECFGVIVDNGLSQAFSFFAHLAIEDPDVALQIANAVRTDSMGTGIIVYFPGYQLEGV